MFGQIHHIFTHPGRRDDVVALLREAGLPENGLSLVVAEDRAHPDGLWITEAWPSEAAYLESMARQEVRAGIHRIIPLVASFETPVTTRPVLVLP